MIVNGNDYNTKDGTAVRDFIHVSDLAEMHLIAAEELIRKSETEIFNCGYGIGYSVQDIIDTMNKILKKKLVSCMVLEERVMRSIQLQTIKSLLIDLIGSQNIII